MTDETNVITVTVEKSDEALFKQSANWLEIAESYEIITPDVAVNASESLRKVKALYKHIEQKRTAATRPINQALREINSWFKPAKQWLKDAEDLLKGKLLTYQAEQDRIAREAQRKADEEARKERVKLENAAALAEQAGMADRAEELKEEIEVQEIETQEAPAIQSAAPKLEGVHTRITWKAEVTNKLALVKFIAESRNDLLGMIQIDQSKLNGYARLLKEEFDMPGVEAKAEKSIAARG